MGLSTASRQLITEGTIVSGKEKVFMDEIADNKKRYVYHPCTFYFLGGSKYTPDFFCIEDREYIEVVGSRQAFHYNKEKYIKMGEEYPDMKFTIINLSDDEYTYATNPAKGNHKGPSRIWAEETSVKMGISYTTILTYLRGKVKIYTAMFPLAEALAAFSGLKPTDYIHPSKRIIYEISKETLMPEATP
jgi:hypothetical protein